MHRSVGLNLWLSMAKETDAPVVIELDQKWEGGSEQVAKKKTLYFGTMGWDRKSVEEGQ